MQSVLTQCQGEAAATPQSLYIYGGLLGLAGTLVARSAQDNARYLRLHGEKRLSEGNLLT